jgi:hypothetical protein
MTCFSILQPRTCEQLQTRWHHILEIADEKPSQQSREYILEQIDLLIEYIPDNNLELFEEILEFVELLHHTLDSFN